MAAIKVIPVRSVILRMNDGGKVAIRAGITAEEFTLDPSARKTSESLQEVFMRRSSCLSSVEYILTAFVGLHRSTVWFKAHFHVTSQ